MPRRPDDRPPESFLPLPAATFQILLALVGEERHGYAIMKEVADRSDDTVRLGPGTLYGTLKRLLEAGLVEEGGERADPGVDDERRRYYRITALGKRVLAADAERMAVLADAARRALNAAPSPA